MARPKLAELPDWPRLLTADMAASYCSMSADGFRSLCPVAPGMTAGLPAFKPANH